VSWKWQDLLYAELAEMTPLQQFVACGELITQMQQELVPELAERRRQQLVKAAEENGNNYLYLAEMIGSRKATVERLVNEGRARLRELQDRVAA
jgi:hypothetical protein